jgi:hypothetical protein
MMGGGEDMKKNKKKQHGGNKEMVVTLTWTSDELATLDRGQTVYKKVSGKPTDLYLAFHRSLD